MPFSTPAGTRHLCSKLRSYVLVEKITGRQRIMPKYNAAMTNKMPINSAINGRRKETNM